MPRARIASKHWLGARNLTEDQLDPAQWVCVDPDALPAPRRQEFIKRKRGIEAYFEGASDADLKQLCGLSRPHIYQLIKNRCLAPHEDGNLYGWRGALPHLRIKPWCRQSSPQLHEATSAGLSGILQWTFASVEAAGLQEKFRAKILEGQGALENTKRPLLPLFHWFIDELRSRGFEKQGLWPFNVEKLGYITITKYINQVLAQNPKRRLALRGGVDAQRKAKAADGTKRPKLTLLQRVECDAHKLDCRMVVMIPSPHGGWASRKIRRLWVIVIVEVTSRTVLGYYLSLRYECSAECVLRAIKAALSGWAPRSLQFSDCAYLPGAGMPSSKAPMFLGACWDEFSVDGAMANICGRVERQLTEIVECRIHKPQDPTSFASRRSKDDRPYIESFFKRLAAGGMHHLSTTTGSAPSGKLGRDPDEAAQATQFQLEYLEELLDTLVANYNATPHSGLGYRTPLEQMAFLAEPMIDRIRHADPKEVRRMVGIRKLCTLLGGADTGRRPHFNFCNAQYSAEWLCARPDLLGKRYWLHIEDEDDARWAMVSDEAGLFLGAVLAAPPWHQSPHTLYMRQTIRSMEKRRLLVLTSHCDAVEELIRFCEGSEGQRLPVHPAYLQARRTLQGHAEALMGLPMVDLARQASQSVSPPTPPTRPAERKAATQHAPPARTPKIAQTDQQAVHAEQSGQGPQSDQPPAPLPPMRMAKVW